MATAKSTKPPVVPKEENSPSTSLSPSAPASPSSPGATSTRKLTPALKRAAIAPRLRSMSVKKIGDLLNINYKIIWN